VALFIVCVIDVLGFGILIPLIPYMATQFGASPAIITPILGTAPIWGRLSDRYGRRPILIASMAGAGASYLMLAGAHSLTALLVARALAGFMAGNLSAALAYASDISSPRDRAKTMGTVGAAIGIGFMLGPAIGGALAGEQLAAANFLRPALVAAGLSLLALLLVVFVLRESHTAAARQAQRAGTRRLTGLALLRTLPALRALALGNLLVIFSQSTLDSSFAIWAMNRYGLGPRSVGLAIFALAIVAVLVQGGLMRVLAPRFGEHRLALAGVLGYFLGLTGVALAHDLPWVIAALVVCGFGAGLYNPTASALASREANEQNRGAVMGTFQSSTSLARVLAPFLAGTIYERFGPNAPFLLAALITLQAFWCILAAQRLHLRRGQS
jgi:DHA1 family tetracycline resistance protein-like MFS transporter